MEKTSFTASDAPRTAGGYVQAVRVSDARELLLVSGQVPVGVDGHVPADFCAQADLAWRNLDAQIRAAGLSKRDLVKVTIFLSSRDFIEENRTARNAYLDGHEVALTVIITGIFDEAWLLEIEAMAAR